MVGTQRPSDHSPTPTLYSCIINSAHATEHKLAQFHTNTSPTVEAYWYGCAVSLRVTAQPVPKGGLGFEATVRQ